MVNRVSVLALNRRAESVRKRYLREGWRVLRGGAPDFLMLKVVDRKIVAVRAVEVKGPASRLTYEQSVYREVLEQVGIEFEVEVTR